MLPGIGGGGYRRRSGPILTPLQLLGADLLCHYEPGVSAHTIVSGEVATLNDLSLGAHHLADLGSPHAVQYTASNGDIGGHANVSVIGGTTGCLSGAMPLTAGAEVTLWGALYIAGVVTARVWACAGTANLDATDGRTGFASIAVGPLARFYVFTAGGQETIDVAVATGWHVCSIVYRGAGQTAQLYVDGALVGESVGTGGVAALSYAGFGSNATSGSASGGLFVVGLTGGDYNRQQIGRYITQQTGLAA